MAASGVGSTSTPHDGVRIEEDRKTSHEDQRVSEIAEASLQKTSEEDLSSSLVYSPENHYREVKPSECLDLNSLINVFKGYRPFGILDINPFINTYEMKIFRYFQKLNIPNVTVFFTQSKNSISIKVCRGENGVQREQKLSSLIELGEGWDHFDQDTLALIKNTDKDKNLLLTFLNIRGIITNYRIKGHLLSYFTDNINEFGQKIIDIIISDLTKYLEGKTKEKIKSISEKLEQLKKLSAGLVGESHEELKQIDKGLLEICQEIEGLLFPRINSSVEYQE